MKITKKKVGAAVLSMALVSLMALPLMTSAQVNVDLENAQFGLGNNDLKETIQGLVGIVLSFLGILAVLIVLWGGFIWMTAVGDESKVEKAKKLIISGIIGLVIIFSAYAIASFVITNLQGITNG